MREIEKIREFLGSEPLKKVEKPEGLSLEELFQLFLPDILPEREKRLLTEFFIYKYKGERLTGEEGDKFLELEKIDTVMGGEFLPSIVSQLKKISIYMNSNTNFSGYALTSKEFWQLLFNMLDDYCVRFDVRDLKILNAMRRNVFRKTDIAKQTGIDYRTVLNHTKKLEERCGLRVVSQVDYPKIGLTHLVFLVEGKADFENAYPLSRYELGFGEFTLFSMGIPPREVKRVEYEFENKFSELRVWTVDRFESVCSFDNYDTDSGEWNIDWTAWSLYLSNVLSKGWDAAIPQRKENGEPPLLSETAEKGEDITDEDLRFIDALLEDFDISSEDLGERCDCSESKAAMVKERILNRGILRPYIRTEHTGLNEKILFIVESDADTLNSFVVAVKELPRALIYWMKPLEGVSKSSSALACWLETPPGSFFPFERAVRLRLRPLAEYMLFLYRPLTNSESESLDFRRLQSDYL